MFHELVESAAVRKQSSPGFAAIVSLVVQSFCLVVLLLLPLIFTQALPSKIMSAFLIAPPPSVNSAKPAPLRTLKVRQQVRLLINNVLLEPHSIPSKVAVYQEPLLASGSLLDSQFAEAQSGLNLLSDVASALAPERPLPPVSTAKPRIQVGGGLEAAKVISQARPIYPILAQQAGIQGDVVLRAIINEEGGVSELHVVSGPPLLVKAALDAVKSWRYRPTLLNGQPVEVDTTITVSFVLGGR